MSCSQMRSSVSRQKVVYCIASGQSSDCTFRGAFQHTRINTWSYRVAPRSFARFGISRDMFAFSSLHAKTPGLEDSLHEQDW